MCVSPHKITTQKRYKTWWKHGDAWENDTKFASGNCRIFLISPKVRQFRTMSLRLLLLAAALGSAGALAQSFPAGYNNVESAVKP